MKSLHRLAGYTFAETRNIEVSDSISHNSQEIFLQNIIIGTIDDNTSNPTTLLVLNYIYNNASKEEFLHPDIALFMNDFQMDVYSYGNFYSSKLPPGKKQKNMIAFYFEEYGDLEIHVSFLDGFSSSTCIRKTTISKNPQN